jgi:ABC-type hemin transport system substrate-binding protein
VRVVSLVPSLTETAAAFGLGPDELVGRTDWCVHPEPLVARIPALGGTKTPRLEELCALRPDLVLLDREENRLATAEALRVRGIPLFVSEVRSAAAVPELLRALGRRLGRAGAGEAAAEDLEAVLAAHPHGAGPSAVPLIWRKPLMALAPARYGGDLLARAGLRVLDLRPGEPYPRIEPAELARARVEVLLLPSEPHPFTLDEGLEIADAVLAAGGPRPRLHLVDGQDVTWFGARTAGALRRLGLAAASWR